MEFVRNCLKKNPRLKFARREHVIDLEDYESTYVIIKRVLLIAGLRTMRKDSPFAGTCWNIYYGFSFVNMVVITILEIMFLTMNTKNDAVTEFFKMMPVIGYMFLVLTKSVKMKLRRDVFENIVKELRDMWPRGELSQDEYQLFTSDIKDFGYAIQSHYMTIFLSFVFSLPPIIIIIKLVIGLDAGPMYLPYKYWLPFDPYQSLTVYTACIVAQTYHCIITVWGIMSADLLFCIFVNHLTIQLHYMGLRIKKLFYVPIDAQLPENYPLGKCGKDMSRDVEAINIATERNNQTQELKEIVLRHGKIIRLASDVENMFSFSLLATFLNSSMIICFSGLCIIFIEKWSDLNYKICMISTMLQSWVMCWYGQKIIDASTGLSDALYNGGWYMADNKVKKSILIMMRRSQKELHVTTSGFSVISLSTFTTIMKWSWSYFTLLINVMK